MPHVSMRPPLSLLVVWAASMLAACAQFDNNAGLARTAVEAPRVPGPDDANDASVAPIPGASGSAQGGEMGTQTVPVATGFDPGASGVPFPIRAALYEGGGPAWPQVILTLWSLPISCTEYQANRLPSGISFLRIALAALPASGSAPFTVVADAAALVGNQTLVHLNTPLPRSLVAASGQVTVTQVTPQQLVEGSVNVTFQDGSASLVTFAGPSAARFCSL